MAACTQDETLSPAGDDLPADTYPLQIGNITITTDEQLWTRVSEKPDGSSSVWNDGDEFHVKFEGSDEVGTYRITDAATGAVKPVKSIYWKSTQPAKIIAWYATSLPNSPNWVHLLDQEDGLAYVLRATADNASYDTPVSLQFKHQLAKVRVVTTGTADVGKIEIVGIPTGCNIQQGEIIGASGYDWLPMRRTTYQDGTECWEANVVPGEEIRDFIVSNTNLAISRNCEISPYITPEAGKVHTVTITANSAGTQSIRLSTDSIGNNGTEQSQ